MVDGIVVVKFLGSLAAHEVPASVKFENSLSRLWGEGGQSDGGRGGRVRGQEPTEPCPLVVGGRSLLLESMQFHLNSL